MNAGAFLCPNIFFSFDENCTKVQYQSGGGIVIFEYIKAVKMAGFIACCSGQEKPLNGGGSGNVFEH